FTVITHLSCFYFRPTCNKFQLAPNKALDTKN
ncbi:MAG: hypothetical protein ACI9IA_001188, partial [Enterobacterales bacterium]